MTRSVPKNPAAVQCTAYEITNFKAFAASGLIPIRPITLIYGPNSSGKSSVLQSLLLLKQTLEEAENPETLLLPKGLLVDLGGYREFVFRHETERPVTFRLLQPAEISRKAGHSRLPSDLHPALGITDLSLRVGFGYDNEAANVVVKSLEFFADNGPQPFATFGQGKLTDDEIQRARGAYGFRLPRSTNVFRGTSIDLQHPLWRRLWDLEREQFRANFPWEIDAQITALQRQLDRIEAFERGDHDEQPGGKRRRKPRSYADKSILAEELEALRNIKEVTGRTWEEGCKDLVRRHERTILTLRNFLPVDATVLPDPSDAPSGNSRFVFHAAMRRGDIATGVYMGASRLLRSYLDDLLYLGPLRESPERHYVFSGNDAGQVGKTGRLVPDILFKDRTLLQKVNEQLQAFNIGYELIITGSPSGELNDVFSLRLRDRRTKVTASILDVGFGISQVLPVIVQSLLATNKTLCIEQPEIHLHPRLQADLGSLLVEATKPPYSNRFVIETHSQHLLLRVQNHVRKRELRHDDISVIYVDKTEEGSRCIELRLDEDGSFIDEWPDGFFEEGYLEMLDW